MRWLRTITVICWMFQPVFSLSPSAHRSRGWTKSILKATSSSELKHERRKEPSKGTVKKESVVKRLKKAATRAHNAAKAKEAAESEEPKPKRQTVLRLMELLDRELEKGSRKQIYLRPGDSVSSLQNHNVKWQRPKTSHKRDIALVMAKALYDDQISIEGAARIRSLVKKMVEEQYEPDLIVFVGPTTGTGSGKNLIADADGSYLFFRHLCASIGLQLSRTEIRIEHHSMNEKALREVVEYVQNKCKPQWLEAMAADEWPVDEQDVARNLRKRLSIHFSLFSSEYQLCQLNDIHVRSPNQSALRALTQLAGSSTTTSWSFHFTVTPQTFTDPVRALAAKTYKSAQDLVPVLYNLRGVIGDREFFQNDNYKVLVAVRHSIITDMERLHEANNKPMLEKIRQAFTSQGATLDVVLEGALLSLGRCLDLVRPAGLMTGMCSKEDFERALNFLQQAYYLLDRSCDPDLPLPPDEWGVLRIDRVETLTNGPLKTANPSKTTGIQFGAADWQALFGSSY